MASVNTGSYPQRSRVCSRLHRFERNSRRIFPNDVKTGDFFVVYRALKLRNFLWNISCAQHSPRFETYGRDTPDERLWISESGDVNRSQADGVQ